MHTKRCPGSGSTSHNSGVPGAGTSPLPPPAEASLHVTALVLGAGQHPLDSRSFHSHTLHSLTNPGWRGQGQLPVPAGKPATLKVKGQSQEPGVTRSTVPAPSRVPPCPNSARDPVPRAKEPGRSRPLSRATGQREGWPPARCASSFHGPSFLAQTLLRPRVWLECPSSFSGHSSSLRTHSPEISGLSLANSRGAEGQSRAEEVRGPPGHSPKPRPLPSPVLPHRHQAFGGQSPRVQGA